MKTAPSKIEYVCPCGETFPVTCYPGTPARTSGVPENCHPEEGGEIEPRECDRCGALVNPDFAKAVATLHPRQKFTREYELQVAVNTFALLYRFDVQRGCYGNSPNPYDFDGSAVGYWERRAVYYGASQNELNDIKTELRVATSTKPREIPAGSLADALQRLLAAYDEENGVIHVSPDPGCIECTCGVTPNRYNTGLCPRHAAEKALAKAKGQP